MNSKVSLKEREVYKALFIARFIVSEASKQLDLACGSGLLLFHAVESDNKIKAIQSMPVIVFNKSGIDKRRLRRLKRKYIQYVVRGNDE